MLTAIEGIYENGQVILTEIPPTQRRVKVYITFTNEEVDAAPQKGLPDLSYLVGSLTHLTPAQNAEIDRELTELRGFVGANYLLDTNAVSKALRNLLPDAGLDLIRDIIARQAIISVVTRIELIGFDPKDERTAAAFALFVQQATELGLDEPVIRQTIELRKRIRIKLPDAILAATALVHNLTLVSDNDVDFLKVSKLKYINPTRV